MKVLGLIPCLMLDNNREENYKAMDNFKKNYPVDKIVVYDQEFKKEDYKDGFEYIGYSEKRVGFVKARNELLKYFYNSDFDYALWMDANGSFSRPSLNSLNTIIHNLRNEDLDVDVLNSTLGIISSGHRISDKKRVDYFENCRIMRITQKRQDLWMHGLIMKNYKKYYNKEFYCNRDVDKGVAEDVYFLLLLQKSFTRYECSDLVICKPSNKASTWVNDKSSYDYPPDNYFEADRMIEEDYSDLKPVRFLKEDKFILPRVEKYKEFLRKYHPRKKHKNYENQLFNI